LGTFQMYPACSGLGKLESHGRGHLKCTQPIPTGHIGVTCCLYSQCIQHVPGGYLGPCPQCQQALRPHVVSCDTPALRPYELQHVPTTLRCFPTTLRCIFTMLRCIFMMLRHFVRRVLTGFEGCHRTRDSANPTAPRNDTEQCRFPDVVQQPSSSPQVVSTIDFAILLDVQCICSELKF